MKVELAGSEFIKSSGLANPSPTPPVTVVATPTPTPRPKATPTPTPSIEDWPFKIGEQLNYQVFLGGSNTPVGLATFQVRARSRYFDRDGLYLMVTAETTGAVARLFVAKDTVESYVDPKSLLPYRTVLSLVEGKRRLNQTLTVNQDRGNATTEKGQRIDIPVGTHDYLSFFYVVRTFNLSPSRRQRYPDARGWKTKDYVHHCRQAGDNRTGRKETFGNCSVFNHRRSAERQVPIPRLDQRRP